MRQTVGPPDPLLRLPHIALRVTPCYGWENITVSHPLKKQLTRTFQHGQASRSTSNHRTDTVVPERA